MRLYHGSNMEVARPLVAKGRPSLDFGQGFYLTSFKEQASTWAKRKTLRSGGNPLVNAYDLQDGFDGMRVLTFEDDESWVEFVCTCRKGGERYKEYDLIIGGVADDRVFAAVDFYMRGLWDISQTLEALRYYRRNDQYCVVSQWVLDERLTFAGAEEVSR